MIRKLRPRLCWEQGQCIQLLPLYLLGDIINNKLVCPKGNQPWLFIGGTDGEAEAPILWPPDVKSWLTGKDPDAETDWGGDDRGRDGWMASPTQWTWVWASSRRWWLTGKPVVLQSMGSQRVGHDWASEQQLTTVRAGKNADQWPAQKQQKCKWKRIQPDTR